MLPKDWKQQIRDAYPKRRNQEWGPAFDQIEAHIKNGEDFSEMLKGANSYRRYCLECDIERPFRKMARTFFGPRKFWLEDYDEPEEENALSLDDKASKLGLTRQSGESDESLQRRTVTAEMLVKYPHLVREGNG